MVQDSAVPEAAALGDAPDFAGRLTAEAVRAVEALAVSPLDDTEATRAAIEAGGPFESRLVRRAEFLVRGGQLPHAVRRVQRMTNWTIAVALIVAGAGGGIAAKSGLVGSNANVLALLAGLLSVQLLMLVLWALHMLPGIRVAPGGILGAVVARGAQFVVRRLRADAAHLAAAESWTTVNTVGRLGRWTLATITHSLWVAFNLGALCVLALLFLGEGYQFRWDSTWLSADAYGGLVRAVSEGPRLLGFTVPDAAQVAASRSAANGVLSVQDESARAAWSWMFFGAVIAYGLLPRAGLLTVSIIMRRLARAAFRLDETRIEYARLRHRLCPDVRGTEDPATTPSDAAGRMEGDVLESPVDRPTGAPVIVGLEIARPATGWPPRLRTRPEDLGILDGREDVARAVAALLRRATSPRGMIIVCELRCSPDRGIGRHVRDLARAAGSSQRVHLVLTGGRDMARHADQESLGRRLADWRSMAEDSGIPLVNVVEIDLDHLTETTRVELESMLGGASTEAKPSVRRLEAAFQIIHRQSGAWGASISLKEQGDLHREIAAMYGHAGGGAGNLFAGIDAVRRLAADPSAMGMRAVMRDAGDRITRLLPPGMRANPRWLVAGALAGALGCLASAALIAPAAAASLPLWSALGAAVAAAWPTPARGPDPAASRSQDFEQAIDAACLFAFVLELQGREEAVISRVLDRVFSGTHASTRFDAASLNEYLQDLRRRFDLALAAETMP